MKKRVLNRESEYLRIGTTYYKKVYKPLQHVNKSLHGELKEKIPFSSTPFLSAHLPPFFTTKTWFAAAQIMTAALRRGQGYNSNKLEMGLEGILLSIQDLGEAVTKICLTPRMHSTGLYRKASEDMSLVTSGMYCNNSTAQGR